MQRPKKVGADGAALAEVTEISIAAVAKARWFSALQWAGIDLQLGQTSNCRRMRGAMRCFHGLKVGAIIDTINNMGATAKVLNQMRREPANVRFSDLLKVCTAYFGQPRQQGTSHAIFKTPWPGDPRVNIQNGKGKAKAYQVRQVLLAIDKLERKL